MAIKNKVLANKAFPWRCGRCGEKQVEKAAIRHVANIKHEGKKYELVVPDLVVPKCSGCGEILFDNEADDQISVAFRKKLGLLQPSEIRQNRKKLELGQKELASFLGVAPESISRWENGAMLQSQSNDRLLRLYFESKAVRERLSGAQSSASDASKPSRPGGFVRKSFDKKLGEFVSTGQASETTCDSEPSLTDIAIALDKLNADEALKFVKCVSRALFQC